MFNKHSLRLALSGSVLVILIGSMTGCSEDPTAPKAAPQHDTTQTCNIIHGIPVCTD
jgi:hypothetical protein